MNKFIRTMTIFTGVILVLLFIGWYSWLSWGRGPSRIFGRSMAQVLNYPHADVPRCVTIRSLHGDGVKEVTVKGDDGEWYTHEAINASILEATIHWVKFGSRSSWIRTRKYARVFGNEIRLELPEDFGDMSCVSVTDLLEPATCVDSGGSTRTCLAETGEHVKTLAYYPINESGKIDYRRIVFREYYDGLFDRNFEGWMEVRATSKRVENGARDPRDQLIIDTTPPTPITPKP